MNENNNETADVRKLATIAKIFEITPIEGAENIELASVRGWHVVVKKGEFKSGDLCVYVEVDSVLPDGLSESLQIEWKNFRKQLSKVKTQEEKNIIKKQIDEISKQNIIPQFEFLRSSKFRIKTKKIFEQISQGICFPLSILPLYTQKLIKENLLMQLTKCPNVGNLEDMDVTDLLGIIQYVEPEISQLGGETKGALENLGILISDEERCLYKDTIIITEDGVKTIKQIYEEKYFGKILSYNSEIFLEEWKNIENHSILKNNNDWFKITLENGDYIISTSNHKFYLPKLNCFRQLKDLNEGEYLLIINK